MAAPPWRAQSPSEPGSRGSAVRRSVGAGAFRTNWPSLGLILHEYPIRAERFERGSGLPEVFEPERPEPIPVPLIDTSRVNPERPDLDILEARNEARAFKLAR